MSSTADFSELVALLYAAPLQPANWEIFLDRLSTLTGMTSSNLISINGGNAPVSTVGGGPAFDPEPIALYNEHFSKIDPYYAPCLARSRVGLAHTAELVPRAIFTRTEFFNDFFVPSGFETKLVATFTVHRPRLEFIVFTRPVSDECIDRDHCEFLKLLLPHLHAASRLYEAVSTGEIRALRAESALDRMQTAAFLLSPHGRILHRNLAAEAILNQGDGLLFHQDRLLTRNHSQQTKLDSLIASVASLVVSSGALAIIRSAERRPLQLRALPLRFTNNALAPLSGVLLLVTDPEQSGAYPRSLLQEIFALTPAEAKIANAMLTGLPLCQIAEDRRASLGTVRLQLKRILQKTGTHSQTDLMRLLSSLPKTWPLQD